MKMTHAIVIALGASLPACAIADFQWLEPFSPSGAGIWSVVPGPDQPDGGSLTGHAEASLLYNEPGPATGTEASLAEFSRSFSITGSPDGWRIDLSSDLQGFLGGLHGSGSASYVAVLSGNSPFHTFNRSGGGGGMSQPFSEPRRGHLHPSGWELQALRDAQHKRDAGPASLPGLTQLRGASGTFNLSLLATPVPEPASWLLLGLGGLGLAMVVARRGQDGRCRRADDSN